MRRIATIGVYGFTAGTFLEELTGGGVGLLLDLRQRRGVRGPDYSWANSARLQRALAAADIGYRHIKGLAPTSELRQLQYREDDRLGVGKRNRIALAPEYAERYTREILDPFDLGALWRSFRATRRPPFSASSAIGGMPPFACGPRACVRSTACRSRTSARSKAMAITSGASGLNRRWVITARVVFEPPVGVGDLLPEQVVDDVATPGRGIVDLGLEGRRRRGSSRHDGGEKQGNDRQGVRQPQVQLYLTSNCSLPGVVRRERGRPHGAQETTGSQIGSVLAARMAHPRRSMASSLVKV
jgi:hypothetical protein